MLYLLSCRASSSLPCYWIYLLPVALQFLYLYFIFLTGYIRLYACWRVDTTWMTQNAGTTPLCQHFLCTHLAAIDQRCADVYCHGACQRGSSDNRYGSAVPPRPSLSDNVYHCTACIPLLHIVVLVNGAYLTRSCLAAGDICAFVAFSNLLTQTVVLYAFWQPMVLYTSARVVQFKHGP
jgi:hypothetical protein